ncbi:PepSY domain-containing protein [Lacimicrobium alkaliphilum]|uniref:PepSY domain-containing protein n=1 Tax=Lacimicrobium alkaliphilum TaxID=1526571 RepID=A0A0U3AU13_9ALTE|nr:PepSY domain-containing protein [Lacimicrobium alkaliphilum]ALS97583.1 hypothetical protein AT746_04400 [Lacimicrobium alkaliphilum]
MRNLLLLLITTVGVSQFCWADYDKSEVGAILEIVNGSGMSATQAMRKAMSKYQGHLVDYELEDEDGLLFHEIKLIDLDEDTERKVVISVHDGNVVSEKKEKLWSWFKEDDDIKALKKLVANQYSMLEAIEKLGLATDDLLLDIELEDKQGVVYFEIEVFSGGEERELLVDSKTKSIIPVFKR